VSFVSIFWYNLNGFLNVENVRQFNFFPAKKAPDDSRGVVLYLELYHGVTSSFFGIGILLVSDLLDFRYYG
jgi:hypothetical protein